MKKRMKKRKKKLKKERNKDVRFKQKPEGFLFFESKIFTQSTSEDFPNDFSVRGPHKFRIAENHRNLF